MREFIFDKVKIDRAFVSRMNSDRASEHIIKAVLAMCEGLELRVVAEGIEEHAEAAKLKALGCAMGQGYYFGKPADSAATLRYLQTHYFDVSNEREIA